MPNGLLGVAGRRTASDRALAEALHGMIGVDFTAVPTNEVNTALIIAKEIDPDFSALPTALQFSSWLGPPAGNALQRRQAPAGAVA